MLDELDLTWLFSTMTASPMTLQKLMLTLIMVFMRIAYHRLVTQAPRSTQPRAPTKENIIK